jgi:hypothetical protein
METTTYIIQDREAGNKIEECATRMEANAKLANYEQQDMNDGDYTPDCYEIVEKIASS